MTTNDKVVSLDDARLHRTGEAICVRCLHRYVAVWPDTTPLRTLACPGCRVQGYVILTGEVTP
jgi:hypothetical protein